MFSQPFFIPSALITLLSIPLIFGWIPRQFIYGVRTPKTLSNDEIWYPANRFAGVVLLISSGIYFAAAWTFPDASTTTNIGLVFWLVHLGAFALPLIASLFLIRSYVQSL